MKPSEQQRHRLLQLRDKIERMKSWAHAATLAALQHQQEMIDIMLEDDDETDT